MLIWEMNKIYKECTSDTYFDNTGIKQSYDIGNIETASKISL